MTGGEIRANTAARVKSIRFYVERAKRERGREGRSRERELCDRCTDGGGASAASALQELIWFVKQPIFP